MGPYAQSRFHFVNVKHPGDLNDEETKRRVRRIVMTDIGKARRKPKTKRERTEIVLEMRDSSWAHMNLERFGGGQMDPFCLYPIEMNDSSRKLIAGSRCSFENRSSRLLHHLVLEPKTEHTIRMRDYWYPVGISCAAILHSLLSIAQDFTFHKLHRFLPSQKDALGLTHLGEAFKAANAMMNDSSLYKSDAMIGTISSLMCHHVLLQNFADGYWYKHRNALVYIAGLRGGYEALNNECLQVTLTWVDLIGSFSQDIVPVIPIPARWRDDLRTFADSPRTPSDISTMWKRRFPLRPEWIKIFDNTSQGILLDPAFGPSLPLLSIADSSWVEATVYELLSIRPLAHGNEPGAIIEEVCRLGTLLFLTPVWRLLGRYAIGTAVICHKLLLTLTEFMVKWNELKPLLVWVLYFAAMESKDPVERSHFVFMLAAVVKGMHLYQWDAILSTLRSVLWVEKAFLDGDSLIRDEVMQLVNQNHAGGATLPHTDL